MIFLNNEFNNNNDDDLQNLKENEHQNTGSNKNININLNETTNAADFQFDNVLEKIAGESFNNSSSDYFETDNMSKDQVDEESLELDDRKDGGDPDGVDRNYIDANGEKNFSINTKKYKLWSLENISNNNKFVPIITPLINESFSIPSDISDKTVEELKRMLDLKFNSLFKEYIKDSKLSKLKIEATFDSIIKKIEKSFHSFKNSKEDEHKSKVYTLKKSIGVLDEELIGLKQKLSILENNLKSDMSMAQRKKEIFLLSNKAKMNSGVNINEGEIIEKEKFPEKEVDYWKERIEEINEKIDNISKRKADFFEKINKENLEYTNLIDTEFIKKEKDRTKLEVDKIEVFIFLRENLVSLNRIIRDIKIQIGIKNIQNNNKKTERIFDEISESLDRTKKQFELLDKINRTDNKIKVEQSIDTSTRIIDLKTGEVF